MLFLRKKRFLDYPAKSPVGFLTQHGKEDIVSAILEPAMGFQIERVPGFDTDSLGTFTREIPRRGTQQQAAQVKAKLAVKLSRTELGLGSEGSFGRDPVSGLIPWNIEALCLYDKRNHLSIYGWASGPSPHAHGEAHTWAELVSIAERVGFPSQHLVLRQHKEDRQHVRKGIDDWAMLRETFHNIISSTGTTSVFAECDLRAFCSPSRRETIKKAAWNLSERLKSICDKCGAPGFWKKNIIPGRKCRLCGEPTDLPMAEVWWCLHCHNRETRAIEGHKFANPGQCAFCNP
jgi:hypothetical protein